MRVPREVVAAARSQGWLPGRVEETRGAWLFYARDGRLVCRLPRDEDVADIDPDEDIEEIDWDPEALPADVLALALARGWRGGRIEETGSAWVFHTDGEDPIVVDASFGSGVPEFVEIVEAAWEQGFRVEETERGWYFCAPGSTVTCCGIARGQERNPRVLQNLLASLREAGFQTSPDIRDIVGSPTEPLSEPVGEEGRRRPNAG